MHSGTRNSVAIFFYARKESSNALSPNLLSCHDEKTGVEGGQVLESEMVHSRLIVGLTT